MGLNLTPIEGGRGQRVPLEDIRTDVSETIEEAFKEGEGQRFETEPITDSVHGLTGKEAADEWLTEARSYAYQRPAGRLVVTGNAVKTGAVRFMVETYVKPEKDETDSE